MSICAKRSDGRGCAYILSSGHHARHGRVLAGRQQDSSLHRSMSPMVILFMRGEGHTRIEEDEPVRADEVDTASTSFATEQEDELLAIRVVELIDKLLAFVDSHRAVQTEVSVPVAAYMVSTGDDGGGCMYSLLASQ